MKPIFAAARKLAPDKSRIVFAEGEEERVLRAVQVAIDEKLARPLLVGRPAVIEHRISQYGLRLKPGQHYDVVNPEHDPRYREYWESYYAMMARRGIPAQYAKLELRRRTTLLAPLLLTQAEPDRLICATIPPVARTLESTHNLHRK